MKELSPEASAKLLKIGRSPTNQTREVLRKLFSDKGVPVFDSVIETFVQFGGYRLPVPFENGGDFKIYQAKEAIRLMNCRPETTVDPNLFRIPFGESKTIQAYFLMDGNGTLYEDEKPISKSMVDWIERWAKSAKCLHALS